MIEIMPLAKFNPDDLLRLVTGYTSDAKYAVSKSESVRRFTIALELVSLPQPFHKRYDHLDAETMKHYQRILALGFSFGAYDEDLCMGFTIAEPRYWNKSLWVWELQVAKTHRRRGIGRRLVNELAEKARGAGLRSIVCETQNTNVPAIRFYRKVGFNIEGIDLSYYSNNDFPDGEIALFMKKRIMR